MTSSGALLPDDGQLAQKIMEARLREAEAKFQTLVEHGSAIVYLDEVEYPSKTIYMSPQVIEIFGWTPEELLEDQDLWWNSIHPDDLPRVDAIEREAAPTFSVDYRVTNQRGELVWLHEQGNLVTDDDGTPMFWLGLAIDITESKRAESLERDLILEQATSAKLKALDQAKDDLLVAVSHDFRSPLSNILGFGLTLQRSLSSLEPADIEDYVERIVQNAWKLERLVSDVLDVSRLREGLLELKMESVDVGTLVEEIVGRVSLAGQHDLQVEAASVMATVDPAMLERVIDNLIMNAERHNPEGVHIVVGVRAQEGGVEITVVDDGVGVPADLDKELFEPFTSGEEARHAPQPGLGLGLAIVQQVIDLHGGRVTHEPTPGGGATFRIFLPER